MIEVKRPGEEPTKLQKHRLMQWAEVGAVVAVAERVDDVKKMIARLDRAWD